MHFREAQINDITAIQFVRHAVRENKLSDPSKVTDEDCKIYITERGRGWVCEHKSAIVGFAIVDLQEHNVWALFVLPEFEGKGIGKELHKIMMDWYFQQTDQVIWLSTGIGTRAVTFYSKQGWQESGLYGKDEVRFEMSFDQWQQINKS